MARAIWDRVGEVERAETRGEICVRRAQEKSGWLGDRKPTFEEWVADHEKAKANLYGGFCGVSRYHIPGQTRSARGIAQGTRAERPVRYGDASSFAFELPLSYVGWLWPALQSHVPGH